jgi:hypothetical protein
MNYLNKNYNSCHEWADYKYLLKPLLQIFILFIINFYGSQIFVTFNFS